MQYVKIRDLIKTGDMLEWSSPSILGKTIRLFTGRDVNHTSLAISFDDYFKDGVNHKFVLEAEAGGIELNLISKLLTDYKGKCYWYQLKPELDSYRQSIGSYALLQIGTKYDFGSLLKNAVSRVNADAKKLFCSEYYYMALCEAGILSKTKVPRPGEFIQYGIHLPRVQIEL